MEDKATVLVTGGTGFVGLHIVLQLLQQGYNVRTTVRNLKSKDKIINTLLKNGVTSVDRLSVIAAELTADDNWAAAMKNCQYVLSVASPVFFDEPQNEQEAIRPAVEGVLRILKFAKAEGVKRVVMTSNFGAVGFTQFDKTRETTEADWTDTNAPGLSVYEKSKTLAEQAAWEFMKKDGGQLEFATINAVGIWGPSLSEHVSRSFHLLQGLLNGSMKMVPNIPLNVVDVRDVADLHIKAMIAPEAAGQRFLALANGQISLPEIAALFRNKKPEVSQQVSLKRLPNWLLRVGALFNARAKEGLLFTRMNRNVSNQKAKQVLGWQPIATKEETLLASVDSMVKYQLIDKEL